MHTDRICGRVCPYRMFVPPRDLLQAVLRSNPPLTLSSLQQLHWMLHTCHDGAQRGTSLSVQGVLLIMYCIWHVLHFEGGLTTTKMQPPNALQGVADILTHPAVVLCANALIRRDTSGFGPMLCADCFNLNHTRLHDIKCTFSSASELCPNSCLFSSWKIGPCLLLIIYAGLLLSISGNRWNTTACTIS